MHHKCCSELDALAFYAVFTTEDRQRQRDQERIGDPLAIPVAFAIRALGLSLRRCSRGSRLGFSEAIKCLPGSFVAFVAGFAFRRTDLVRMRGAPEHAQTFLPSHSTKSLAH
jgi:hypothetical protein